jgi:hypothetical protein
MLGLGTLPPSPVVAQNCANIGPGAFLAGCDLSDLDLSGVNLAGANLRGADLSRTDLTGANLGGANLSGATITEGALDTANTAGANLRGIRWVPGPTITLVFVFFTEPASNFGAVAVRGSGFTPGARITFDVTFNTPDANTSNALNDPPGVFANSEGLFYSGESPSTTTTYISLGCTYHTFTIVATDGSNTASWTGTLLGC